jgi:LPXTG-motif cell wall-anchored protein
VLGFVRKERAMPDFMQEWWFIVLLILLGLGLIGLLMFLRSKRSEED